MNEIRARLARLPLAGRVFVTLAPIAVALVAVIVLSSPSAPTTAVATPTPPAPTAVPSSAPPATIEPATPSPGPTDAAADPLLGLDGRFTILLLGSDYRPTHPGNRTDAIMVVSISPVDGSVAALSIPRDTARFPLPDGGVYDNKINALYQATIARLGREPAGTEIKRIIGTGLGIEIDWYAVIGMYGVTELIDAIGGVDVTLETAVNDPYYWVNSHTQGVHFPAGKQHLNGARALIFARTRQGDSDFQRARRQQILVLATASKVLDRGEGRLPALVKLVADWVRSDLGLEQAAAVYALVQRADLENAQSVVLGPRYADKIPGSVSYELRLDKVRALTAEWFAPAEPTPAPSS
ncbi:MAG: LytR family transcriptional regulator [Chloroflexi bacterium]|nr:LytR family transcriptional regulator [Chloroflexota bacterium]